MTPKNFSVRDTAQKFGFSLEHVYKLIWSGKLPAVKGNNGWVISQVAIDAYCTNHAKNKK